MSMNNDGTLDPDEALRMLELAAGTNPGKDIVMRIDSGGTPIEGESRRRYKDGKARIDLRGYHFWASAKTPPGSTKSQVTVSWVSIVRDSDAATASIASLLNNGSELLTIFIQVFKAGGDPSVDEEPVLEIVLEEGRVRQHTLMTGGNPLRPMEIMVVAYRYITINSAAQDESGLRGPVRSCSYSVQS